MLRHASALWLLALAAAACNASTSAPAPKAAAEGAKAEATPAEGTAKEGEAEKVAAADATAEGDHAGCIYVEGQADGEKKADGGELECPHPPAGGEAAEPQGPATGEGHFGSPFTLADAKPLAEAISASAGATDTPVLVTGEVEAVCQKKGCWMVVKDGTQSARVLMKDHSFAVPMDCRGKSVTVEGTLASRTFTEAQVKHLAKDGGKNPDEVSGERTEHVLTATGISIKAQS